jgi:hypothetical protein
VVGASDAKGEDVKDRPVYPGDLLGSIYELMGIAREGKLPDGAALDHYSEPDRGDPPGREAEGDYVSGKPGQFAASARAR